MRTLFPYELMEDPRILSGFQGWREEVYDDLLKCQSGRMTEEDFRKKYSVILAILVLDMTGFTKTAIRRGNLFSFLRIFNVQKICAPVLLKYRAKRIRTFADDFTATFENPFDALNAALEVHRRVDCFNQSGLASDMCTECCIGLGYGEVFKMGPDLAMGDEMNQTSKLGEDTAKGGETLLTKGFYNAVNSRSDVGFESCIHEDLPFAYYRLLACDPLKSYPRVELPRKRVSETVGLRSQHHNDVFC